MPKSDNLLHSLSARLTLVFLALILISGGVFLVISNTMNQTYSLEVMQGLNQSVAMYVADQQPLIERGRVNEEAMDELASRAMILNPSLEIYLLDPEGEILSHRLPQEQVTLNSISTDPISTFLSENAQMPILGQDPSNPEDVKVFSAAPIMQYNEIAGYVYAIIGGQMYQDLRNQTTQSYSFRVNAIAFISVTLITAILGGILFFVLTKRLRQLKYKVEQFSSNHAPRSNARDILIEGTTTTATASNKNHSLANDEIDELNLAFTQMSQQINQQFDAIQQSDETRRELIANVSHDLRTPLASMQGYIETLIVKSETLSSDEQKKYLDIAHRHSRRLSQLVSELFELAKLESKNIEPNMEPFSLLELMHDSVQEFGLRAANKNIDLSISAKEDCRVTADIALIHRVLQNLIDNALQHTPEGGKIKVQLVHTATHATVEVSDTGRGIQTHEIPFIFDRFYRSKQQDPSDEIGTGLGLAIVKRILDLHKCRIDVKSRLNEGTSFMFELPNHA